MNKKTTYAIVSLLLVAAAASGAIVIDPNSIPNQSSANMNVFFNADQTAYTGSPYFGTTGTADKTVTTDATIGITMDAMDNASIAPSTFGDELADGTLNQFAAGLGVDTDPNATGIGGAVGGEHEGISFAIDEVTNMDGLSVQITHINVQNVGRAGTDTPGESFTVVNLLTRQSLTWEPLVDGVPAGNNFDVSSLNLTADVTSASLTPIAAIVSGDIGGFRVDGLTVEVIPEPATLGLIVATGGAIIMIRRRIMILSGGYFEGSWANRQW